MKYKLYTDNPEPEGLQFYKVEWKEYKPEQDRPCHRFNLMVNGELLARLTELNGQVTFETWPTCDRPEGIRQIAYEMRPSED